MGWRRKGYGVWGRGEGGGREDEVGSLGGRGWRRKGGLRRGLD